MNTYSPPTTHAHSDETCRICKRQFDRKEQIRIYDGGKTACLDSNECISRWKRESGVEATSALYCCRKHKKENDMSYLDEAIETYESALKARDGATAGYLSLSQAAALLCIAESLERIADNLDRLSVNNAGRLMVDVKQEKF